MILPNDSLVQPIRDYPMSYSFVLLLMTRMHVYMTSEMSLRTFRFFVRLSRFFNRSLSVGRIESLVCILIPFIHLYEGNEANERKWKKQISGNYRHYHFWNLISLDSINFKLNVVINSGNINRSSN